MSAGNGVWIAEHHYRAGTCPGCRAYLWADVIVDTEVRPPRLSDDGKPSVDATARIVKVSLVHTCAGENDR